MSGESGENQDSGAFVSDSPEATRRLAECLGRVCRGGEVLLLYGDLGAGKTCFVQGLARGLGVPPALRVTSPTFTLHGEYPGRLVLNHLDLYRLDEPAALAGLGMDDLVCDGGAVLAVEWPEMLADAVGNDCLEIRIADTGNGGRLFAAAARGKRHAALLDAWRKETTHAR